MGVCPAWCTHAHSSYCCSVGLLLQCGKGFNPPLYLQISILTNWIWHPDSNRTFASAFNIQHVFVSHWTGFAAVGPAGVHWLSEDSTVGMGGWGGGSGKLWGWREEQGRHNCANQSCLPVPCQPSLEHLLLLCEQQLLLLPEVNLPCLYLPISSAKHSCFWFH